MYVCVLLYMFLDFILHRSTHYVNSILSGKIVLNVFLWLSG